MANTINVETLWQYIFSSTFDSPKMGNYSIILLSKDLQCNIHTKKTEFTQQFLQGPTSQGYILLQHI